MYLYCFRLGLTIRNKRSAMSDQNKKDVYFFNTKSRFCSINSLQLTNQLSVSCNPGLHDPGWQTIFSFQAGGWSNCFWRKNPQSKQPCNTAYILLAWPWSHGHTQLQGMLRSVIFHMSSQGPCQNLGSYYCGQGENGSQRIKTASATRIYGNS